MKTIILDLTGCKSLYEIHEKIRVAFDFPEWYGKNWSAFWDLLWSECDADRVIIRGEATLPDSYAKHIDILHSVLDDEVQFRKSCEKYGVAPFSYVIES